MYIKINDIDFKLNLPVFITFILGIIFATALRYFEFELYSSFSYFIYIPVLFYAIKPTNFHKLFFNVASIWFIGMFLDIISMILVSCFYFLFKMDIDISLLSLLLTFFVFAFMLLLARCKFLKRILDNFYKTISKIKYYDFLLFILIIFILVMAFLMLFNINLLNISILVLIIIFETITLFSLSVKIKLQMKENIIFLKNLKENNDFYILVEDEHRILKHNLIAKLLSVKSVSNKKASQLIDDLIKSYSNNGYNKNIKMIPYGLNGIIYQKIYNYLNELDIEIINEISYDIFTVLTPRKYNIVIEKLVVFLDNAIEASLLSKEKLIYISIYEDEENIYIEIKNTFANIINIDDLGIKKISSKGVRRGIGLFSLFRDNQVNIKINITNNIFTSIISASKMTN